MALKEDDLVLCKVKKVEGTTVFVDIENEAPGSIVMSEIAAGRIRNIRDYVSPNKKIVCKVLKIYSDHVELSFRRVTAKEREFVIENDKKEKTLLNMLKTITKSPEKILSEIKVEYSALDFLLEAKENPKIVENFLSREESAKLCEIIKEKQDKKKIVKAHISLTTLSPKGLLEIKEILNIKSEGLGIQYLGSSKFLIEVSDMDFKKANQRISQILGEIEKRASQKKVSFELKEK